MIEAMALVEKFKQALSDKWGYIWGTAGIEWTQSRQNQKVNYLIKTYGADWKKNADAKKDNYYLCGMYGSKWIGHMVADCSGMFVWAFKQFGLGMSHISSNIYKSYCTTKGKLTADLKKTLLPGTAVFTGDTANNHPHVGLYVGNGKVIEAHGTQAGVCTANIMETRWKWFGLLKDVEYPASEATEQPSDPKDEETPVQKLPTLKKGYTGEYVTLLQTKLLQKGYDLGKYGIDGDFGSATLKAVKQFQSDHGLTVDGIVGEKTWAALEEAGTNLYTVTIHHLPKFKAESLIKDYAGSSMVEERG